jgi:hypothetical protein
MALLQVLVFYGMMAVIMVLLYRVSNGLADLKRTIQDMEERIVLAQLPRKTDPERT